MSRVLRILTRPAPAGGRAAALAHFRQLRESARAAAVNYWVFEDAAVPDSWVEFIEARDADALRQASRQLQLPAGDDTILSEVELD